MEPTYVVWRGVGGLVRYFALGRSGPGIAGFTGEAWRWDATGKWVAIDGAWALNKLWTEADWEEIDDPPEPLELDG